MTQEEKQLLLKDLCMRLPYDIKASFKENTVDIISVEIGIFNSVLICKDAYTGRTSWEGIEKVKPYLRPMFSMTEEEIFEFIRISDTVLRIGENKTTCILSLEQMDWLNAHHFDYRGLIERGLALEVPIDMYKTK